MELAHLLGAEYRDGDCSLQLNLSRPGREEKELTLFISLFLPLKRRILWEFPSCEKKRSEKHRRKGKIYPFECRVTKNSKERLKKKPSSEIIAKK